MLDDNAYLRWLDQCGFSDPTRTLLTDIRRSPPVRRVAGGRGNIHGRYPSRKMRRTIQFESHTELGAIYLMEHDPGVLEYWDQPTRLKLHYRGPSGRQVTNWHAKTELKKQLRGVRPIERALEAHSTPENETIRGYCLAVRASLTDDRRSPLEASGLLLHDRLTQVNDSIARVQEKKITAILKAVTTASRQRIASHRLPVVSAAKRLHVDLAGSPHFEQSGTAHGCTGSGALSRHLHQMQEQKTSLGTLSTAIDHFLHITNNFAAGLFHSYDMEGLPRTNNELEHCFGVARVHERRATGRRGAIPGVVVRGSVRLTRFCRDQTADLSGTGSATR